MAAMAEEKHPVSVSNVRAEIDTSPPFGSVQEAVTRFGGRGSWVPCRDYYNGVGEFDIKRMEEHAAELEKELIVKELETLDVLEALGTTKRIVEDLKKQLHQESLRSDIKEMNNNNPMSSSPDMILLELKQAKMNLVKTMNDLVKIQSSVESLNKKMKQEKDRFGFSFGLGRPISLAEELSRVKVKPLVEDECIKTVDEKKNCLRTAEMRLVAARKMEEAAKASEELAIAEIRMFSSPRGARNDNDSRKEVLKKLEEATEGVKESKEALEDALDRIEIANVKQIEAENAFRGWEKDDNFTTTTPVVKSNVSMRDVLRCKQVAKEEEVVVVVPERKRNVNLSQMLKELKEDVKFSARVEKEEVKEERQFVMQRRKFGFIHITLPMHKQSKKK